MSNSELRFKKNYLFLPQDAKSGYTNIPMELMDDESLSLVAWSVMCYLLRISIIRKMCRSAVMETYTAISEDEINAAVDELIAAGYLVEVQG